LRHWRGSIAFAAATLACVGPLSTTAHAQPAAVEPTRLDPPPDLGRVDPAALARAHRLVGQALPLVAASQFDRARPLLTEAARILEGAWPPGPGGTPPVLDEAALLAAALQFDARRSAEAELIASYAVAAQFRNREEKAVFAFGRLGGDASRVASLALIRWRAGTPADARQIVQLLARSPSLDIREAAEQMLLGEVQRLTPTDTVAAGAVGDFALAALKGTPAAEDRLSADLTVATAAARSASGQIAHAAAVLASNRPESIEQRARIDRNLDDKLIALFARGDRDVVAELLGQLTNARPDALGPAAAARVEQLADTVLDPGQAAALRESAIGMYERSLKPDDPRLNIATVNLASLYTQLHRDDEAEQLYRKALAVSERVWGVDSDGSIEQNRLLAAALMRLERPGEAEALLRRQWTLFDRQPDPADLDYLRLFRSYVDAMRAAGNGAAAQTLSAEVLAKASAVTVPPTSMARYRAIRAELLLDAGDAAAAEPLLRQALAAIPPKPRHKPGEVANFDAEFGLRRSVAAGLAAALEAQGKLGEAEPLRRLTYDPETLNGPGAGETIDSGIALADLISRRGDRAEADRLFAELGEAAGRIFGADSRQAADVSTAWAAHLLRTGRAAQALEQARAALGSWEKLQDRINPSAGENAYLARLRRQKAAAWLAARAELAVDPQQPPPDAFEALQRAELTAAGAALARKAAAGQATRAGAAAEHERWQAAQRALAALDGRIGDLAVLGASGDAERLRLERERDAANTRLVAAERALRERFPRFFDLIASKPAPLAAFTGKASVLRSDEALVLLAPGSDDLPPGFRNGAVMVVTREGTAWAPIPLTRTELSLAESILHNALGGAGSGQTVAPGLDPPELLYPRQRAHQLYRALFGDPAVAALLAGKARWTLVPQGPLIGLPFAALVTDPPPGGAEGDGDPARLRATRWLGWQTMLAISPSVPAIVLARGEPPAASASASPFVGIGDPAFRGAPDGPPPAGTTGPRGTRAPPAPPLPARAYFGTRSADPAAIAKLERLGETAGELKTLATILEAPPSAVLLQMDATEAELRRRNASGELGRAAVIAFATHGLLGGELANSPAEPSLALTPMQSAAPDPANDGLLTASEAAGLTLSARFVILSACNTAAGGASGAEGLAGLARAFLYDGAQSLLASYYPIFDQAAPRLTSQIVGLTRDGRTDGATAMRRAIVALASDPSNDAAGLSFAHPKSWAAFALVDPR
jgi:hypothetical protein